MPRYVVKVARDSDEYVWWSDITEAPIAIGDRDYVMNTMREYGHADEATPDRFDRADRTGCSAMWPNLDRPIYHFDGNGPIAEQKGFIPRDRLGEYVRLHISGDLDAAYALLEPLDD